jgi:hypothetical protein
MQGLTKTSLAWRSHGGFDARRLRRSGKSRTAHAKQDFGLGQADADVGGRRLTRPSPAYRFTR